MLSKQSLPGNVYIVLQNSEFFFWAIFYNIGLKSAEQKNPVVSKKIKKAG